MSGTGTTCRRWLGWVVAAPLLLPIRAYQLLISPLLGPNCRFQPTCSAYMAEAIGTHGPLKGGWMGLCRLLRCHPWGGYGYDPVPARLAAAERSACACTRADPPPGPLPAEAPQTRGTQ